VLVVVSGGRWNVLLCWRSQTLFAAERSANRRGSACPVLQIAERSADEIALGSARIALVHRDGAIPVMRAAVDELSVDALRPL
jgi:hypothetical protein